LTKKNTNQKSRKEKKRRRQREKKRRGEGRGRVMEIPESQPKVSNISCQHRTQASLQFFPHLVI